MSYYCLVHVQADNVPRLRDLSIDTLSELPVALAIVLREWSSVHRVEIFVDDSLKASLDAGGVEAARKGEWSGF